MKPVSKLKGTSIMVLSGSPEYKSAPLIKGTNRLAYIPFEYNSDKSLTSKEKKEAFNVSLKQHNIKVKNKMEEFKDFQTYSLDKVTNTSIKVFTK